MSDKTTSAPDAVAASKATSGATPDTTADRNQRRTLIGTVTSTKMQSTLTVQVERTFRHRKYGKFLRERKRYHVHAENGSANVGDKVEIVATRPISKLKRWRLVRVIAAGIERGADVVSIAGTTK